MDGRKMTEPTATEKALSDRIEGLDKEIKQVQLTLKALTDLRDELNSIMDEGRRQTLIDIQAQPALQVQEDRPNYEL